jgi:hypothetical protein
VLLTKNTCVVGKRHFRMVDLEKGLWMSDDTVFFTSSEAPNKIACLEIWVRGCYHLAYSKNTQNLVVLTKDTHFAQLEWTKLADKL